MSIRYRERPLAGVYKVQGSENFSEKGQLEEQPNFSAFFLVIPGSLSPEKGCF